MIYQYLPYKWKRDFNFFFFYTNFFYSQCVTNPNEKNRLRLQICQLPIQQFEGLPRVPRFDEQCDQVAKKMYHYDFASQSCLLVDFPGCFGTDNLFPDKESCTHFCGDLEDLVNNIFPEQITKGT